MKFLSIISMAFVLLTSSSVAAEQLTLGDVQEYCWKTSYGREVGKLRDTCAAGLEKNMSWCYPQCKPGYESNGLGGCNQKCKPGSRDDGLFCRYVEEHVDEFPWQLGDPAFQNTGQMNRCRASAKGKAYGCEQNGWLVITKCAPGQEHILGFCRTKNLNCKALGYAGQFDLSCTKYTYSRTPQDAGCAGGLEDDAGLCYKKCDSGFYGVGPVCWSSCPTVKGKKWVACGAGCAKDDATCGLVTTDQVVSSLDMAFSIASTVVTAGAASPLSLSAKIAGRKMLEQTKSLRKVYEVSGQVAGAGTNITSWMDSKSDSSTMDQEAQAWLIAQTSLDVASMVDPTGVASVVNSFTKPLCSRIGTKPKPDESAAGLESVMSSEKNYVKFLKDSLKFAQAFQNNLHALRGQAVIEKRRVEDEEKQVTFYKKRKGELSDDRYRMTQWYPSNTQDPKIFAPAYNGKRYLWAAPELNYTQAAAYCKQHNAHLAEVWELQEANNNGYSRCAASWLAGGEAGYVMVGTHKGCGKDGFNDWSSNNKAATLGAYCVGSSLPAGVSANSATLIEKGWKEYNLANYDKLLAKADALVQQANAGKFYTKAGKVKVARYEKQEKDLETAWLNAGKTVSRFEQKLKNAQSDYKRLIELKNDPSKLVLWGMDSGKSHSEGKTYAQAQEYCISKGGLLATKQHMTIAQEAGFEMCSSGWLADGSTGHVMQQARSDCGKAGFNKGDIHLKTKGDAEKHKNLKRATYCVASKAPAGVKAVNLALNYYYLSNQFLGDNKVMTLDGKNRLVMSTKAANNDRQKWRVRENENGWYRLYNKALGADMSVDSGKDQPNMAKTGDYTGQAWHFTPAGGGWYRLSNDYQGINKVLDTYNAEGNHLFLENKAKNTTGSFWKKVNVNGVTAPRVSSATTAVAPKNNPLYKGSATSGSNPLYKAPATSTEVTAAITLSNGATYLFNTDGTYSKYSKGRTDIDKGYPAKMPGGWQGLPSTWRSGIDAATPYEGSNKAYMFKDGNYVRLNGVKVDKGYPANMPGGWQGVPKSWRGDVDAAFYYAEGKKHYFFKGDEYIGVKGVKADRSKPSKLPGGWVGMPAEFVTGIDAATFRAGHVYMFKGDKYIRFTGTKMDNGYPKPIKNNWPR